MRQIAFFQWPFVLTNTYLLVFLVGHNVVLSLNISNVSRGAITSLSFLPNINADPVLIPFVAALDQIDVCPSKSTSAHLFYNIGPLLDLVGESFSVSCLVSYFKGKEKQFHTVPEKRIGLDLAALERNVTFVSDVAALKCVHGTKTVCIREGGLHKN